ncbi:MAG: hypothetical protein HOV81_41830 [Kofleriaceae bacterium]|nr:hypothetical protein [Kofleriaceae bacterium]
MSDHTDEKSKMPWRPPTRRAFVTMLGAAAAALALREKKLRAPAGVSGATEPKKTIWIGHC